MRNLHRALRTGFLLFLLTLALVMAALYPALAAGPEAGAPPDAAAPASLGNWFDSLIPVLAPLLVALIKVVIPRIPKPLLPLLATGLGVALDYIGQLTGVSAGNPILGAVLGAAGVGLREALDQTKKSLAGTASVVVLFLALSFAFTGCASHKDTVLRRERTWPDGRTEREDLTTSRTRTLADSQSKLANVQLLNATASNTVSIGIGSLSQSSAASNAVASLEIALKLLREMQGK